MSVQLNPQDFRELVDLVQALSAFSTERDRIRLVSEALAGSPRADRILGNLDLSGGKRGAAVEVVKTLADFGQVVYGKEALGIFLSSLQDHVGVEQGEFLDRLFATYPLNTAAVARLLKAAGIPVLATDCGGGKGRQLSFEIASGDVTVEVLGGTPTSL